MPFSRGNVAPGAGRDSGVGLRVEDVAYVWHASPLVTRAFARVTSALHRTPAGVVRSPSRQHYLYKRASFAAINARSRPQSGFASCYCLMA